VALREVAVNWKKSQPKAALGLLEKGLQMVPFIPEGARKNRVAAELAVEAASVDKEWTLRWISQVPDPSLRDLLCQGAGNFWAEEDPVYALKAAGRFPRVPCDCPFTTRQPRARPRKPLFPS
jgi:hypothetical protein